MMQRPESLYSLISESFKKDFELLCDDLEVDIDELSGSTRSTKALSLQQHLENHARLHELLAIVHQKRDNLILKPYLYLVIAEQFSTEQAMVGLLEGFGITVRHFMEQEKHPWGQKAWREQKALALQTYMEANGRIAELIHALQQRNSSLDLRFYLDQPKPANGQKPTVTVPTAVESIQYEDFDLRIRLPENGRYPIEVLNSPQGNSRQAVLQTFPLDDTDFEKKLEDLTDLFAKPDEGIAFGRQLRDLLFPADIWPLFFASLAKMQNEGKGLRIRLRIDPPEISRLPWEYCYDETYHYFALNQQTPIVRYIAEPFAAGNLAAPRPLKVVVAVSSPTDLPKLDTAGEIQRIQEALEPLGAAVKLTIVETTDAWNLQRALSAGAHIFHFIGHGLLDSGKGYLALMGNDGKTRRADADQMRALIAGRGVKVVILNACQTAAHGTGIAAHEAGQAIMSVAPALVRAQVPAVIAMQFPVPDRIGVLFTRYLYTYLADGTPLDTAVTEMRTGAYFGEDDKIYWGIPTLFMRAPDGVIWQPAVP
jgi:hypothetical protein